MPLPVPPPLAEDAYLHPAVELPIAVIAGHRPRLLANLLISLYTQPGLQPRKIVVLVDGVEEEMAMVAHMYGARAVLFPKTNSTSNMALTFRRADEIASHYLRSLTALWDIFPRASNVLVLEEDLVVGADFLSYFSQTLPLLKSDPTLLAVSAWNDNAFKHSSSDPSRLYRTEFFPGLGWLLSHELWSEIEPKWPRCCRGYSWDLWLRDASVRGGRDCIMPDVPRTFHAGKVGANMNPSFFDAYFAQHALNNDSKAVLAGVKDMRPDAYNKLITQLLSQAQIFTVVNGSTSCTVIDKVAGLPPTVQPIAIHVFQAHAADHALLQKLCTCMKVWDLGGVRGLYRNMLRLSFHGHQLLLVGSHSPFAVQLNASHVPREGP